MQTNLSTGRKPSWRQMVTVPWLNTKDLVILDVDWRRNVTSQLTGTPVSTVATEWRNGPRGLHDNDDDIMMMMILVPIESQ